MSATDVVFFAEAMKGSFVVAPLPAVVCCAHVRSPVVCRIAETDLP